MTTHMHIADPKEKGEIISEFVKTGQISRKLTCVICGDGFDIGQDELKANADPYRTPEEPRQTLAVPTCAVPPGAFTLSDGSVIELSEWFGGATWRGFFSALIVPHDSEGFPMWRVFGYGRSQPVTGDNRVLATRAHTNLPRTGEAGLPKGWEMLVYNWRATMNVPLVDPVMEWASETSAAFWYNEKRYGESTLLDLLMNPLPINPNSTWGAMLPIYIRENLAFHAEVQTERQRPLDRLREWLRDPANPRKSITCWLHIDGPLKKAVV